MMENGVAVLLPLYNGDSLQYFEKALNSIKCQTVKDIKVFIGVDGPVDDAHDGFLNHLSEENGIKTIRFTENRGLAAVLNDLLSCAKTEGFTFFARMDADDISMPDRFEKQVSFLLANPEVDVVGGAIEEIDGNDGLRGKHVEYPLTHEACRDFFRYRDCLAHPAVMFRASFFDKVPNGYRLEYRKNQDTMLWFDGFMNGCIFANIPDVVLHFRVNENFYNRRNGWKRAKQMLSSRLMINKSLKYDISANVFAVAMFFMTLSPSFVKKFLYKIR